MPAGGEDRDLNELADLVERVKAAGVEDIVLDLGAKDLQQLVERNTIVRKNAVRKTFRGLGYPILVPTPSAAGQCSWPCLPP